MKVIIPGGAGQVGAVLARSFHARGDDVIVLSRQPAAAPWRVEPWDAETLGEWAQLFEGADVVINLAGRNVNCRYTPENQRQIMDSRVRSTRIVGEAIARASQPPGVWLQASTATIYSHRYDAPNDDVTGVIGGDEPDAPAKWRFSIEVAQAWERAVDGAAVPRTRKVKMRSAMIMSPDAGGIFDTILGLVRRGLGGRAGSGRQYFSWMHYRDFISAVDWLIERDELDGAVNLAAPYPLPNAEFMKILREAWGIKLGIPSAEWMLKIGARLMGTETELILKSRRVVPARLLQSGFTFRFPTWREAAADLVQTSRLPAGAAPTSSEQT